MSELRQINLDEVVDLALMELDKAEQALDGIQESTILVAYSNYEFKMGMFYAYMNVVKLMNLDRYVEISENCKCRIDTMLNKFDKQYRYLKEMCEQ